MSPALESPLRVWHLVVGLSVTVLGGAFTAGSAYASMSSDIRQLQGKAQTIDAFNERMARMEERMISQSNQLTDLKQLLERRTER